MKVYKITMDSDCYAVSLVEEGAIESNFIALSKEKERIQLQEEKRLLIGAALIPDKPIYRNIGGREFYIIFDKDTIERLSQNFLINDYQHNITEDHKRDVNDVVVVESWIKTSENDKSVGLGLDEPIGTWFISMKVNNDEIWEKVKDGTYKGFSIEAIVGLDEVLSNKVELSMDKEFIDKLRELLYEVLGKTPKAEEVAQDTLKEIIEEQPIQLDAKDEEIAKLKEDVTNLTAEVERIKSERDELESKLNDVQAERDSLAKEKEDLTKEKEELAAENVKLSKQPSVQPNQKSKEINGKNYKGAVSFLLGK